MQYLILLAPFIIEAILYFGPKVIVSVRIALMNRTSTA